MYFRSLALNQETIRIPLSAPALRRCISADLSLYFFFCIREALGDGVFPRIALIAPIHHNGVAYLLGQPRFQRENKCDCARIHIYMCYKNREGKKKKQLRRTTLMKARPRCIKCHRIRLMPRLRSTDSDCVSLNTHEMYLYSEWPLLGFSIEENFRFREWMISFGYFHFSTFESWRNFEIFVGNM